MAFRLFQKTLSFPDPEEADDSGLLAVGGDLSVERLKLAYSKGIFPWYEEGMPVLWWSPDPRMVLFPDKMIVSHSLRQTLKKDLFTITYDTCFEEVVEQCSSTPRAVQEGTWITGDMKNAYNKLHKAGYAHSAETWHNGQLVGGLYGVALGRAFFGESMFHRMTNASKVALYFLLQKLRSMSFEIIDAQVYTNHLESLGGELLPRTVFLELLQKALEKPSLTGRWTE
ncbi:MAG TPA: leucyl/phenylalanyl-tRNA--protein transferase [Bacteroidales bacterium]|nr:leucyl/phenylalanyl-tRNA--protein transferase [Bacteroidales bacterium]